MSTERKCLSSLSLAFAPQSNADIFTLSLLWLHFSVTVLCMYVCNYV